MISRIFGKFRSFVPGYFVEIYGKIRKNYFFRVNACTSESIIAIAILVQNLAKILWLCLDAAVIVQRCLTSILILTKRLSFVDMCRSPKIGRA